MAHRENIGKGKNLSLIHISGKESPAIFNPKDLDAEEWVKTFKDAGITAVIIVCKHHDGFCVWPSKYTIHTVKYSPWREGLSLIHIYHKREWKRLSYSRLPVKQTPSRLEMERISISTLV